MKKIVLTIISIFLLLLLIGCGDKPVEKSLSAPTNISFEKGVISFDEVAGATDYQIKIYQGDTFVLKQSVASGDDLSGFLPDGDYEAEICSIKGTSKGDFSSKVSFYIGFRLQDVTTLKSFSGEELCRSEYINWSGRTWYQARSANNATAKMNFYYTASGFKVSFTGTELKASFYSANKSNSKTREGNARLVILVDGEVYPDQGHTLVLSEGINEYTLCSGLSNSKHCVEVLKRTESADNSTALVEVKTDGHFETPKVDKAKRILLIGASGSAGHGSIGSGSTQYASNSDGLRAFPYLVARYFDCEIDEINASGWGCVWGWNSQDGSQNIPKAFGRVGISVGGGLSSIAYDYTKDSYDLIIVNLGMNDFNAYMKNLSDPTFTNKLNEYKAATKAFYELLTSTYNCPIVIVHTSESNSKAEGMYNKAIAEEINTALGKVRITSIIIPANGSNGDAYGANTHANVGTHIKTADLIIQFAKTNLNWTMVNAQITYSATRDLSEINLLN